MKRCGKSAPRRQQWRWQGKPHTEQDQIGEDGSSGQACRLGAPQLPGRSLEPCSDVRPRGMVAVPLPVFTGWWPTIAFLWQLWEAGYPVLPPSFGGRAGFESVEDTERHTEFGLQARQLSRIGNGGACPRFCYWFGVTDKPQIPATPTRIGWRVLAQDYKPAGRTRICKLNLPPGLGCDLAFVEVIKPQQDQRADQRHDETCGLAFLVPA